ncbi:MAG TPA: hypothetical protein VGE76_17185 [Opitutaceae bacterium]
MPEFLRGGDVFANYTKFDKGEAPNRNGVITTPTAPNFYHRNAHFGSQYVLSFTAHLDRLKLPFLR